MAELCIGTTAKYAIKQRASKVPVVVVAESRPAESPRFPSRKFFADGPGIEPRTIIVGDLPGVLALREEFVQGVAWTRSRHYDESAALDPDVDLGPARSPRTSSGAGGTASMTEPPTLRGLVVCMGSSRVYVGA